MARLYDATAEGRGDLEQSSGTRKVRCACAADAAEFEVVGLGRFTASFAGFMEAEPGAEIEQDGIATVPLTITGHETAGTGDGLGRITVSHDFDRPLRQSSLRELTRGEGYPAEQQMWVNILVTVEALPGVTLRSIEPGLLRNPHQTSFPPRNAVYTLEHPVDLEDREHPGQVVARVLSYNATINPDWVRTDS